MNQIKDFLDGMRIALEQVRTKDQAQVRLINDDKSRKIVIELAFHGTGRSRGTKCWDVGHENIVDPNTFGVGVVIEATVQTIIADLRKENLVYEPPLRVVRRTMHGEEKDSKVAWRVEKEDVIWDGFSIKDYERANGRIGRIEQRDEGHLLIKVLLVMQELQGGSYVDMPTQPTFTAPSTIQEDSDKSPLPALSEALRKHGASSASLKVPVGPTATERKRARQQQAMANRQQARIDPAEEERRAEQRRRAEKEAEESRRRAEEERVRRERVEGIEKSASASWVKAPEMLQRCTRAWKEAAVHEADARDAQVEADLFGGGESLDAGERWIEAESAARELLEFAQARIEEAQARRTGKGFENVYAEALDPEVAEAEAQAEGIQEHTDEAEFDDIQHEREEEERVREEAEALAEPPETGDDGMDEILGGQLDQDDEPEVQASAPRGGLREPRPGVALASIPGLITKPSF